MKTLIISYSLTGNNDKLAVGLARSLAAEHVRVRETKPRAMGTIAFDILFNRTPRVEAPMPESPEYDLIVFVGPVWMGKIASPLRSCMRRCRPAVREYAFLSISGGADGSNPRLEEELKTRLRKRPAAVLDLHIADLLPREPRPTRDDTSAYRVSDEDVEVLTDRVVEGLRAANLVST